MARHDTWSRISVSLVALALICAVTPGLAGKKKREKKAESYPTVSLAGYDTLYIRDFSQSDAKAADKPKAAAKLKLAVKQVPDFLAVAVEEGLFRTVERGDGESRAGAVILEGDIVRFKPGSATARMMMAGAGRAKLDTQVRLVDAVTGSELVSFKIDKVWAWGGAMGMSKGIEDLSENLAVELAMYLKRCKEE